MYKEQTEEDIKNRILNNIKINVNKNEGSFLNNMISPLSVELTKAYIEQGNLLSMAFIEDAFDDFLDKRISEFGVYRKLGQKAHGEVIVIGEPGVSITNGTILVIDDLGYIVLNDITLPENNVLHIEAVEVGEKYNKENTELKLQNEIQGIGKLVSEKISGGIDIESDEKLKSRFKKVVMNPSTSGNKNHYEQWALEVNGVDRAIVYPRWSGAGTVKVMIVGKDNKPVSEEVLNNCKIHIQEQMPLSEMTLTIVTPTLLNLDINASVKLNSSYSLDEVKSEFILVIKEYLKEITNKLVYSKVYGLLANLSGVNDVSSLTLNNITTNINIPDDKILEINNVTFNEVI